MVHTIKTAPLNDPPAYIIPENILACLCQKAILYKGKRVAQHNCADKFSTLFVIAVPDASNSSNRIAALSRASTLELISVVGDSQLNQTKILDGMGKCQVQVLSPHSLC